jgi:hypothetical protein
MPEICRNPSGDMAEPGERYGRYMDEVLMGYEQYADKIWDTFSVGSL